MNDPTDTYASRFSSLLNTARSLTRQHVRDATGRFWLEGFRHFIQASDAGVRLETIVYSRVLCSHALIDTLVRRQRRAGVKVVRVCPEQFRHISGTARASGIGAVARQTWTPLKQADPRSGLGWLAMEEIRSPGNLGTILRTAEAVGMAGVIFLSPRTDPFDPSVIRSSMGGIFRLKLVRTSHRSLKHWAAPHDVSIIALSPRGQAPWNALPRGPKVLMLGQERRGLTAASRKICDHAVRLPMSGAADSLNVVVAAGVMMYELVRSAEHA
jgi:TrmH family RNA methyltransferase